MDYATEEFFGLNNTNSAMFSHLKQLRQISKFEFFVLFYLTIQVVDKVLCLEHSV